MTATAREGVTVAGVQEACSSCSFDEMGPEQAIQAGVVDLEKYGYVEERGGRLYLKTRAEHMRTFENSVESRRWFVGECQYRHDRRASLSKG
ncbi:MAG: hypothetical protein ACXV48_00275 [Halobacteriota archaeon]